MEDHTPLEVRIIDVLLDDVLPPEVIVVLHYPAIDDVYYHEGRPVYDILRIYDPEDKEKALEYARNYDPHIPVFWGKIPAHVEKERLQNDDYRQLPVLLVKRIPSVDLFLLMTRGRCSALL